MGTIEKKERIDNMRYMRNDLLSEFNRYSNIYPDIEELALPIMNISDVLRAYFILADYFTDTTANVKAEKMLVGIRDMNLLISALGRQNAAYAGIMKYTAALDICSTLFFGLVKNHAFSDGNKRTALLTLLYQLDCFGYCPKVSQREFEKLVVAVASNGIEDIYSKEWKSVDKKYRIDNTDRTVAVISKLLRRMTKKKDNTFHIDMPARDFIEAINNVPDCTAEINGTKIKFQRRIKLKPKFGFISKPDDVKNYSIPYRGDTRTIGAGTARDVLSALEIYDQYPDYSSFFEGVDPRYMLIQQFEGPLRRLKDK